MTKEYWEPLINKWEKSGKTMAAFCQEEKLNYWTFRDWKKRIAPTKQTTIEKEKLVKVDIKKKATIINSQPIIELQIEKLRVQIPSHFDEEHLIRIIRAIRKAS